MLKNYEVELVRHDARTIKVNAESPETAVLAAEAFHPVKFRATAVTEVTDDDAVGDSFEVTGRCEACSKVVFDEGSFLTPDSVEICFDCFHGLVKEAASG